jgi:hypothetical protein
LNGLVHTPDAVAAGSASNANYLGEMGHAAYIAYLFKKNIVTAAI